MGISKVKFQGGIAGGTKYFHEGIIFKFAVDDNGLYERNDEFIMKTAAHELYGLMSLIECNVPGLHFPLLALIGNAGKVQSMIIFSIDFRGYRLIATSVLPIDSTTLIYGR